ncbi:MAG: iron complex outermembrane receptor protein [Halieaceae bacterium]|jgi:iron complex outermembrane receptor protein
MGSDMAMKKIGSGRTAIAVATLAAITLEVVPGGTTNSAYAQTRTLETIVVTARRSAENLKDVPATVNVFTAADIESAGIESIEDVVNLTPGVSIVTGTAEVGDTQINIRGLNGARDAENNIGLVVDGILKTNTAVLAQNQGDVTQIEILKGPQGAYYGRNAAAGAIVMATRTPGEEFEVRGEGIVAEDNTNSGFLSLSGPLTDNVGALLSLDYAESDGFYRNEGPAREARGATVDPLDSTVVNGRIMADLSESMSLDLKARYSEVESGAIRFNTVFNLPNAAEGLANPLFNEDPDDREEIFNSNYGSETEQDTLELSMKLDWDLDWATLTAWGLYSDVEQDFTVDGGVAAFGFFNDAPECEDSVAELFAAGETLAPPLAIGPTPEESTLGAFSPAVCDGTQYQRRDQEDYSFEVTLASNQTEALRWALGTYYLRLEREVAVTLGYDKGLGILRTPYSGPDTINPTEGLSHDRFDTEVYAIFGSLDYDLSETLTLSGALRFDREEREATNLVDPDARNQYLRGGDQPLNVGLDFGPLEDQSETYQQLQPKISLAYVPSDEWTFFGNWGIGFKSGGFNNQGSEATIEADFNNPFIDAQLSISDDFDKETSSAFEVGTKGLLMDGRLTLDAAAYYTEVDDMQFFEFFAGSFGILRVVSNIDEVEIMGAELAFNFAATDNWSFYGSANITDSEIKKNSARPGTEGGKSPYTPDYTGNLGTVFSYPMDNGLELSFRADVRAVGPTWFSTVQESDIPTSAVFLFQGFGFDLETAKFLGIGNFSNTERESYELLNLRATLEGQHWRVTLFANNVTDEEYLAEVIPAPEFGGSYFSPGNRSRFGLEVGFDF